MKIRRRSVRLSFWLFAAALLLKTAMPLLATASAKMQGKLLVEVCTVYGVALVPLDSGNSDSPTSEHAGDHRGEHCALSALTAMVTPVDISPATALGGLRHTAPSPVCSAPLQARDACAAWVARLKHGPPSFA
ncbi:MAG: DUF2946 family protein [Ideonella sp.]